MPPTRAEIAAGLGFSTASSAEDHLQALAKKGAVELIPGASRGLRLTDIPGEPVRARCLSLDGSRQAARYSRRSMSKRTSASIPGSSRRGRITCCACAARACTTPAFSTAICLRCNKTNDAHSGQIVVARLDDEVTVKRLKRRGREIVLVAENARFAPIVVDPGTTAFAIKGIVVGPVRNNEKW